MGKREKKKRKSDVTKERERERELWKRKIERREGSKRKIGYSDMKKSKRYAEKKL